MGHHFALFAILLLASWASAFLVPQPSRCQASRIGSLFARNPEFSVIEDDDDDNNNIASEPTASSDRVLRTSSPQRTSSSSSPQHFEYAALLSPQSSTTLQIQVGDVTLARKAWKKRRRSGSPLLVPCSVLSMDRTSMVRWNMIYLLYKFGTSQKDGVVLSITELQRRHKSNLKGALTKHATALGCENPRALVEALFEGKANQDTYGARLITEEDSDELYLKSPLSKYRALQKAAQATLLQVTSEEEDDDESATPTMKHTGYIRCKVERDNSNNETRPHYKYPPLSAALRVNQREDIGKSNSNKIQEGSIHSAVFFYFDPQGDGGSPLLTLSLNPVQRRDNKKRPSARSAKTHPKYTPIRSPRHFIDQLQVGQGPYEARVVRLARDHALVDFGVGRKFSHQQQEVASSSIGTPEFVKVFGRLRFKDAIDPEFSAMVDDSSKQQSAQEEEEEDVFAQMNEMLKRVDEDDFDEVGEESEDISHLFNQNDDGSVSYNNPETGETDVLSMDDDNEEDEAEEEDQPVTFDISSHLMRLRKPRTIRLKVGDRVPVHILNVAKQSSQFMVTTDPSAVKGKKAKDIKKESDVTKKLQRLSDMLGGLDKAEELRGREYSGTVKATSRAGDWLYVQPNTGGTQDDGLRLPVGVATVPEDLAAGHKSESFAQGDLVRIQLDGIDESRGQLAMHVLEKLSP